MTQIKRRIILCLPMFIALALNAHGILAQSSNEREFAGTINRTLRVRMTLSLSGQTLSGSYAYERVGTSLRLNGEMTSAKEFYLNEFDQRGSQTGRFEGEFVTKDWIEGTWSSRRKKSMIFSLLAIGGKQVPAKNEHDTVSGRYKRVDEKGRFDRHRSDLTVWLLKDDQIRVAGVSIWVGDAKTGYVNDGEVDGIFALQGGKVFFKGDEGFDCRFTITFGKGSLVITDDNMECGGLNVSFNGKYRRIGPSRTD